MLGLLAEAGLLPISFDPASGGFGGADAVVVNTCGFLEASKDESLAVIKEALAAKERGEVQRVVVAGCLVQRHRARMLEWAPGIDAMVGVFDRDKIVEAVAASPRERSAPAPGELPKYWIAGNALVAAEDRGVKTVGLTVQGKDGKGIGYFEDDSARLRLTPRHYAYLRLSEGCNQNCAFCTIPSIRGKMRSKPPQRLLDEARELIHDGAFELLLIGQDTTSYGDDIAHGLSTPGGIGGLPGLLRALSRTMDDEGSKGWLRLMYAYPTNFSQACVDAFAELTARGRLLPYLDIPLQHASDRMLKAMRRNVAARQQEDLIARLRDSVPGMAVRTTFISGFPGETERDHEELVSFVERLKFDAVGVFEYSKEPGTVAGTMEDDPQLRVPAEVKARRRGEVMAAQQSVAFDRNRALVAAFNERAPLSPSGKVKGTLVDVLIDRPLAAHGRKTAGVGEGGRLYEGRTPFQAPQVDSVTFVQSKDPLAPGEVLPCVITASDGYDLIARPVAELQRTVALKVLR
jgi:ribosomal protein S12 methylthiotransferase